MIVGRPLLLLRPEAAVCEKFVHFPLCSFPLGSFPLRFYSNCRSPCLNYCNRHSLFLCNRLSLSPHDTSSNSIMSFEAITTCLFDCHHHTSIWKAPYSYYSSAPIKPTTRHICLSILPTRTRPHHPPHTPNSLPKRPTGGSTAEGSFGVLAKSGGGWNKKYEKMAKKDRFLFRADWRVSLICRKRRYWMTAVSMQRTYLCPRPLLSFEVEYGTFRSYYSLCNFRALL